MSNCSHPVDNTTPTEASPLLVFDTTNDADSFLHDAAAAAATATGQASVWQTIMNLMKTCMGTGCLALAFACQQSGVVLYVAGLLAIAAWNIFCIHRLVQCLAYIPEQHQHHPIVGERRGREHATTKLYYLSEDEEAENSEDETAEGFLLAQQHPPRGTSTFGKVAWYAFGSVGLQVFDIIFVLLLLGIIIAYVAGVISFVGDTPFSVNRIADAVVTGCIMGTMALVPDMGYLSGASAKGLTVLLLAFMVIAAFGFLGSDDTGGIDAMQTVAPSMKLWPRSLSGVSHWFGIVVFGYGVVPLTYNFQESMKEPDKMVGATAGALAGVAVSYIFMGLGLYALFPDLTSDVLHELPATGILPVLTRLAMSWTILVTAPLLIVPCAELLEGKLDFTHRMPLHRAIVRFSVVGVCVIVAVVLPGFVQVLSFVGCFCVALVGFCLPPMLHLRLVYLATKQTSASPRIVPNKTDVILDVLFLAWGVVATIVSTICTLRN
jgi:amino acid permease